VSGKTRGIAPVGFLKDLAGAVAVGRVLGQRVRVPLAAGSGEEIATIDVQCGGELGCGIGDRVDDVVAKRLDVFDGE